MTYSSSLGKAELQLVLDASVLINVLATGHAADILQAMGRPIVIPEAVVAEVRAGEVGRHTDSEVIENVLRVDGVRTTRFDDKGAELFTVLVSGSTTESLGDGEAATIAVAVTEGGVAVIDEKKAIGICNRRFRSIPLATTIDILAHPRVLALVGESRLHDGVLNALLKARMQVREHQFQWIVDLIGRDDVAKCPSLARLRRGGISSAVSIK